MKCATCLDMGYVIVNGHEKIRCPSVHHMGKTLTLTLCCSAVTVHPKALPLDPPLVARVVDVEPEEVLRQVPISEAVKYYGAEELLRQMDAKDIKEHLNQGI